MTPAARALAALLILTGLAACDIPLPFERVRAGEGELDAPETPILCIAPIPGLPTALDKTLRTALATELVTRETLADATEPCPPTAPRILSWTVPTTDSADAPRLMFSRPAGNRPLPPIAVTLPVPADPAQWPDQASRWATMLANRLGYFPPAVRSARAPFESLIKQAPPPAASPPRATDPADPSRVFVDIVEGATGDGNTLLRFAMLGHLRRFGLKPEAEGTARDSAPYVIKGRVDIGEPRAVEAAPPIRRVRIVWTVSNAKGRSLGGLGQVNDVPAAALDHAWGQAADAIAAAAAGGIAEILRRAHASGPEEAAPATGNR